MKKTFALLLALLCLFSLASCSNAAETAKSDPPAADETPASTQEPGPDASQEPSPAATEAPVSDGIAINGENFPDEIFRALVSENFDTNGDGSLSEDERAEVTAIACGSQEICSLKGVEYFTALISLHCERNQLTELDLSQNPALLTLNCHSNQLASLELAACEQLNMLVCDHNQLMELDLSQNAALTFVDCSNNQIRSLRLSDAASLSALWCENNRLAELDLSAGAALYILCCQENPLPELDLSACPNLAQLLSGQAGENMESRGIRGLLFGSDHIFDKDVNCGAGFCVPADTALTPAPKQ